MAYFYRFITNRNHAIEVGHQQAEKERTSFINQKTEVSKVNIYQHIYKYTDYVAYGQQDTFKKQVSFIGSTSSLIL